MGKVKKHLCKCGESNPGNFRGKNKGTCNTCLATQSRERYRNLNENKKKEYIENAKKNFSDWLDGNILKHRFNSAKSRAKRKGIEFNITIQYLEKILSSQNGKCPYTNFTLINTKNKICNSGGLETISIDRIDSNYGYVEGNVEIVSSIVNNMKNNLSKDEFLNIIKIIYNNKGL